MKLLSTSLLTAALLTTASTFTRAEVKLPKLFSSHMVLQRDMPIHLWGEAAPGEQVAVSLQNASATTTTDITGHWSLYLPARPAGGPYTLTVRAANTLTFDDILLGDLWLASGQSNMEMPLQGFNPATPIKDSAQEIAAASHPDIRLLHVEKDSSDYPLDDTKAVTGWSLCSPDTARKISAVGYFFSRALQQKEHVAIGLIDSTWGGTPAEAWTSLDALSADAGLMPVFQTRATRMDQLATSLRIQRLDAEAKAAGKAGPTRPWTPDPPSWRPAGLFNAMIAPFTPLPIRGVLWYQGESNAGDKMAALYSRLFPALIQDWRSQWHQADLPFLFVQLAAYDAGANVWGTVREAQRNTLQLANTGMAVTIDIGEEHNIHPANKQEVGQRLALLARSIAYKETNLVATGPMFRYAYPAGNTMHVTFDNAAGLKAKGTPESFELAGPDGVFSPATARIEADTILVSSPTVPNPSYVRYAWANYPSPAHPANLYNAANLPASPFTTYPTP